MGFSAAGGSARSIAKVRRSLKCKGLRKTLRVAAETILFHLSVWNERRFDRSRNIDTTEIVPIKSLSTLTDNRKFSEDYVPTPLSIIRRSIESVADDLSDFTFIDIGSGKGRVLFKAAEYDFRRIIGIEFSKELSDMCKENIVRHKTRRQKCFSIEAVFEDVLNYEFADEKLVIFMFDPFDEVIVSMLVEKLREHFVQCRKKIYIIYYFPRRGRSLLESDFLKSYPYNKPLIYLSVRLVHAVAMFETVNEIAMLDVVNKEGDRKVA